MESFPCQGQRSLQVRFHGNDKGIFSRRYPDHDALSRTFIFRQFPLLQCQDPFRRDGVRNRLDRYLESRHHTSLRGFFQCFDRAQESQHVSPPGGRNPDSSDSNDSLAGRRQDGWSEYSPSVHPQASLSEGRRTPCTATDLQRFQLRRSLSLQ